MGEWKKCTLGEVLNLRRGYDLPHDSMIDGDIPVAGSNGVIGYHNIATNITPCITVGRSGSAGSTYRYDKAWAHNTTLYVDDFKGNDPIYLYYLLLSLPLKKLAGGSAVPSLNRNHVHPLPILFPNDISIQRKIASILSALDDKIAVNRRICENLEAQAQALFKHWFVDFAPFKDGKFVESELGMIPEGWRVGRLTDIVDLLPGGTPKTTNEEFWNGDIPFFSPKDITGVYCYDTEKYITEKGLRNCSSRLYKKDTIIITCRGTVGKVTLVANSMAMNQSNYAIVARDGYSQYYAYYLISSLVARLLKKANGSTFAAITTKDFDEIVILPPLSVVDQYTDIVTPVFSEIYEKGKENLRLATLRDTLLPKLMSGEIKV